MIRVNILGVEQEAFESPPVFQRCPGGNSILTFLLGVMPPGGESAFFPPDAQSVCQETDSDRYHSKFIFVAGGV